MFFIEWRIFIYLDVIEFKLSTWSAVIKLKLDGNFECLLIVHFERIISLIFKNQSIYFDEPNPAHAKGPSPERLPDWVTGELGASEHKLSESWKLSPGEDNTLVLSPADAHRYAMKMRFWMFFIFSLSLELVHWTFLFFLPFLISRNWFTLCFC